MIANRQAQWLRASILPIGRRIRQVQRHAFAGNRAVNVPPHLYRLILPRLHCRFSNLGPGDQRHLVAVAWRLQKAGANDDLVTAGLLHDIGKSAPGVTIRVTDRVARVVLGRLVPAALARLAQRPHPPRCGSALWVLARHPAAGADLVGQAGYNARVQWLIANHERSEPVNDPDLLLLIAVDEASDRYPAG